MTNGKLVTSQAGQVAWEGSLEWHWSGVEGVLDQLHHGVKSHTRVELAEPRISTIPFFRGSEGMVELGRPDH